MKKFVALFFISLGSAFALPTQGLTNLKGEPVSLQTEKNKELVVFWATWCPDCKEKLSDYLPELNKRPDVAVITINTDRAADRVSHFVEDRKITLPVLRDEEKTLRKPLGVFSVPHWAVYERKDKSSDWKLVDSAPAFEKDRIEKALGGRAG